MPGDNNLHKAAHKGDIDECRKYVEGIGGTDKIGVNDPGASDRRPLHRAAGAGHVPVVKYLVESGATVNMADKSGRTALHYAAIAGHTEVVIFLLAQGADILLETGTKINALHGAVEAGKVDTVRALLDHCLGDEAMKIALTMALNSEGKTPFEIAKGAKNAAVTKVLADMGDPNAQGGSSCGCTVC